jgi:hypothetical protein
MRWKSMQRDQQRQANTEDRQRNEEVTVADNTFCGLEKGHSIPVCPFFMDWRKHTEAAATLSTRLTLT